MPHLFSTEFAGLSTLDNGARFEPQCSGEPKWISRSEKIGAERGMRSQAWPGSSIRITRVPRIRIGDVAGPGQLFVGKSPLGLMPRACQCAAPVSGRIERSHPEVTGVIAKIIRIINGLGDDEQADESNGLPGHTQVTAVIIVCIEVPARSCPRLARPREGPRRRVRNNPARAYQRGQAVGVRRAALR